MRGFHFVLLTFLLLGSSCAFTNPKNTPLVNGAEKLLGGEEGDLSRWIALPIAVPLGLLDTLVVHPAMVIDDAWDDTWDVLWDKPIKGAAMRSYVMIPRLALTPVVFSVDWLVRSFFDIGEGEEEAFAQEFDFGEDAGEKPAADPSEEPDQPD